MTDWFHNHFVPEVEKYLQKRGLEFKVLLLTDNHPGHLEPLKFAYPKIQVEFLPPNTTSVLQSIDQGVIAIFKTKYLKRKLYMMLKGIDEGEDLQLWWQSLYNLAHYFGIVKESLSKLSEQCINSSWKKL